MPAKPRRFFRRDLNFAGYGGTGRGPARIPRVGKTNFSPPGHPGRGIFVKKSRQIAIFFPGEEEISRMHWRDNPGQTGTTLGSTFLSRQGKFGNILSK